MRNSKEAVSDAELLHGKDAEGPALNLNLEGADECKVLTIAENFVCTFSLAGKSADEAAQDYVRLVRLVEKAANSQALRGVAPAVAVTGNDELRDVILENGIVVHEFWIARGGGFLSIRIPGRPPSATAAPNNAADIQTSVSRIEQSQHLTLPPLSPGSGTGPIIIQNDTSSVLTVYLSGPAAQKQVVQPHARVPVTLIPGVYKLAGELADKSVLPFFAVRTYSGGETEQFYIVPR